MSRGNWILNKTVGEAEAILDWLKHRRRNRDAPERYHIQAYRGHGTADQLYISGRVFAGDPVPPARKHDAAFRNLWSTVRRMGSDEVPLARIRASVDGRSSVVLADDEGFFDVHLPASTASGGGEVWREIDIELIDPRSESGPVTARGFAIVPPREARFGIISDIDDTVVKTDVANMMRMLRLVLLTNAHTRLPFEGVAAFYRALHAGHAGPSTNPIFYVSSSPWNFYDLLTEVFEVHDVPAGPFFLKDYGLATDLLLSRNHVGHKLAAISHVFDTHSTLKFVLVGDSGQHDPEIYAKIVQRYPGRVLAIYIRDVTPGERDEEVAAIAARLREEGVELVLVPDTLAAARHAADLGLLDPSSLDEIRGDKAADVADPSPFQSVIKK